MHLEEFVSLLDAAVIPAHVIPPFLVKFYSSPGNGVAGGALTWMRMFGYQAIAQFFLYALPESGKDIMPVHDAHDGPPLNNGQPAHIVVHEQVRSGADPFFWTD
jgi:hypothetical protein